MATHLVRSCVVVIITFIFASEVDDQFSHPGYLMIQSHSVQLLLMQGLYGAQLGCESFLAKGKESVQTAFKCLF